MKSNSNDDLGETLHTYRSRFSIDGLFDLLFEPFAVAFALGFMIFILLGYILQEINLIPPDAEHNDLRSIILIGTTLLSGSLIFFSLVVPKWRKGFRIAICENGLRINGNQWKWEELSGVLKVVSFNETFCQIYANDESAWGAKMKTYYGLRIASMIEDKIKDILLPRLWEKYAAGEMLSFGNLKIHRDQITLNDRVFRTADCQFIVDQRRLVVQQPDGSTRAVARLLNLPNAHLIASLLTGDDSF